ncbi:methyl-accepting chemotaxis protein [Nitrospira sp. M1]
MKKHRNEFQQTQTLLQTSKGGEGAMKQMMQTFLTWGIAAKLVTVFLIFGVLPMSAVGLIAYNAGEDMKAGVGMRFQAMAKALSDKIDRNLAERYGDVQAFGYNDAVHRISQWYDPTPYNTISQVMNRYAAAYGIYDLLIMVDTRGDVVAVNNQDSKGNPIDSQFIFEKNYSQSPWFKALEKGEFTTKRTYTSAGNDTWTGTYIEDTHIDKDVAQATGRDGYVMGFSAPVYGHNGEVVGYWTNRTSMRGIEQMFLMTYRSLKSLGYPGAEVTLIDPKGRVLVDFDPTTYGTEDVPRNFDVLLKTNLVEQGIPVVQEAVAGKDGFETGVHARKQISMVAGYTHLKGSMGFPGMSWSMLVRVPEEEALADANSVQSSVMQTGLICLALIVPIGWFVGRTGAQQVVRVQSAAEKMSAGDYDARVDVMSKDEIGQLGTAFNSMAEKIQENAKEAKEFEIKMKAVNKAQAMIEFNLDGTILTANENFLSTVGYSMDEIRGQHHRMFCEAAYSNSPEYQNFWAKLNRGEFDAGVYKRLGKGNKEVWIQASYNPIMDASGKPYKVVKFATDITGQQKALNEVEGLISAAAKGQLSSRIDAGQFEGSSKALTQGFNSLLDAVVTPLNEAQMVIGAVAQGDLTTQMTGAYQGEFEKIKTSLNLAIDNLVNTVKSVREGADSVSMGSTEITQGNEDLSQRTSQQASALEETSASMEEMTSTIKQNADNAKQANQLAVAAREVAEKGGAVTEKAVDAMSEINKSSKKIADIINVIDEIAFQTNLLALNAAVEAARAGEQGRGFAVVASEVRNLAGRSATAAKEIKTLINESVQKVGDGSELVNQSGQTLEEIVNSVKRVTDIISEISAASQEQAAGIDQVNKAVIQMDQSTQQNAALVEQTTSASQSMRQQAGELLTQVAFFKTDDAGSAKSGSGVQPVKRSGSAPAKSMGSVAQQKTAPSAKSSPAPAHSSSSAEPEKAGVGSGNGHDRRQRDDDFFEEF